MASDTSRIEYVLIFARCSTVRCCQYNGCIVRLEAQRGLQIVGEGWIEREERVVFTARLRVPAQDLEREGELISRPRVGRIEVAGLEERLGGLGVAACRSEAHAEVEAREA